jgi:hypothetical protein
LETSVLFDYFHNFIVQLRLLRAARKSLLESQLKGTCMEWFYCHAEKDEKRYWDCLHLALTPLG